MSLTWLTIDCDDIRHIPKHHGHPTRTKSPIASSELSPAFKSGMKGFEEWLESHGDVAGVEDPPHVLEDQVIG